MTNENTMSGHCLCQKVTVTAKPSECHVAPCHCDSCRRWSSGPFFAVDCKNDFVIKGEEYIKIYDSSDWADRGFCSECGTNLFYRFKAQDHYMFAVGIFEDQSKFVMDHQVFIDEKPAFYNFSEKTQNLTGAECFALYAE